MIKNEVLEDIADIEKKLNTDISSGLSRREARERASEREDVESSFFVRKKRNFLSCFLGVVKMLPAAVLTLIAVAAFFMGRVQLGVAVISTFVSGSVISGLLYLSAQRESERMEVYSSPTVRVLRDGREYITDSRNLVEGDVIVLRGGDYVPADVCIVEASELILSEIYIDGGVKYKDRAVKLEVGTVSRAAAGSFALSGYARAVVIAVGDDVNMAQHIRAGGLQKKNSDPKIVKRAYKYCSAGATLICAVMFIFAVVGILTAKYVGTLEVLLIYLSLMLSLMLAASPIAPRILLSAMLKRASKSGRGGDFAIIKNNRAIDALPSITDVVILGESGIFDGQRYISSFHIFGEQIDDIRKIDKSAFVFECIYAYIKAKTDAGRAFGEDALVLDGLSLALRRIDFDFDAEDIKIKSLYFDSDADGNDFACVEANDEGYFVYLGSTEAVRLCKNIRTESGELISIDGYGDDIERYISGASQRGEDIIAIVTNIGGNIVLEGLCGICSAVCESFPEITSALRKKGIRVTLMLSGDTEYDEKYIKDAGFDSENTFVCGTDKIEPCELGCAYSGYSADEYVSLVRQMKAEGRVIAAIGIDDAYAEAYNASDVIVSYDYINYGSPKYRDVEILASERDGCESSRRCSQKLRAAADVIISRGTQESGGLRGFFEALKCAESFSYYYLQMTALFICAASALVLITLMSFISGLPLISYPAILLLSIASVFFTVAAFSTFKPIAFIKQKSTSGEAFIKAAALRSLPPIAASAVYFVYAVYLYSSGYIMDTAAMPLATTIGVILTFIASFLGGMRTCIGRKIDIADIKGFAEKRMGKNKLLNIAAMTLVLSSIVRMALTALIIPAFAAEYGYVGVCIETLYLLLVYVAVYIVSEFVCDIVRMMSQRKEKKHK